MVRVWREGPSIETAMLLLAEACERIAATTKKLEKIAIVADYLKSRRAEEAAVSAVFLSGRPFPMWDDSPLQVGGGLLWQSVQDLSGKNQAALTAGYRKHGDLGAVAAAVLPPKKPGTDPLNADRKSTRLNSSHVEISYAVFCLKKKKKQKCRGPVRAHAGQDLHQRATPR